MASIKPRQRGESGFQELDAEIQRTFRMKMGLLKRRKQDVHEEDPDSGVVFISHIPHGFFEPQMKKFFSQFGNIKRLRLSRSKKSGRSRGYAYIEFEFSEVAKVVAETMHNYLMYQKLLKCFYVPKEKLHPDTFRGCFRHFKRPRRREIAAARNNSFLESGKEHILDRQSWRVRNLKKKQEKLSKFGVDFKLEGLESELNRLKELHLPAAKEKLEKQTPVTKARGKPLSTKRQGKNLQRIGKKGENVPADTKVTKPSQKGTGVEESTSRPAMKAKKTVATGGEKELFSTPASTKRQSVKGRREVKSAKIASKTIPGKDGGGTAKKSKRISL